ncbi:MAG: Uncharacterized protein XD58_0396 [Thermotoga sp. 50_1627]|uniref:hypothetical protein n=1 Tax=Pseudothermotoga sp. TaxID=2033661 RepID=UPI00076D7F69|nr:MAG: Uncharacterized protein XD45_0203 [Thermotoga sp. 50_64]KUK25528.1 MAG: Uncharacterized protein XD58_0396 [Thermotoga sp. 50_1627]MBC7116553.1 hypothetical protein [Pseudothermotoga sp.]MDK2922564.1 hypothetical protein [Pseudothermotoga sp.]HBT40227.1 hypothetical protein [Pseudothermotoga sp.]
MEGKEVVYILGTKKGAGKTTVLNSLVRDCQNCCISSVGVDGEEKDSLTSEPKPRVVVSPYHFVLTGEKFLNLPMFEVLDVFSYNPIIGYIVLARPLIETSVMIAGASPAIIKELMERHRFNRILVDGALNRLVHAGILDGAKIFLVVHDAGSESLKIAKRIIFASRLAKPPREIEATFNGLEGVWGVNKAGELVKVADSCLTIKKFSEEKLEWLYISGIATKSVLRLKDRLKICLANPLAIVEPPVDFDNIYTVNRIVLEKIFVNQSAQHGLVKVLRCWVEDLPVEIEDVLSIEEV